MRDVSNRFGKGARIPQGRTGQWSAFTSRKREAFTSGKSSAFTLIELLVVLTIISILASILLPVFAKARESSRRSACLSNERQAGMAILLYAQDNDELFPNGLNQNGAGRIWPAEGWAGQCVPYVHGPRILTCPTDTTLGGTAGPTDQVASYAMNSNLVGSASEADPPPAGVAAGDLTASSHTVMLFEVAGVSANVGDPLEGSGPGGTPGTNFSAASNGLDNRLYAQRNWSTSIANTYATGYLGGRQPFNPAATQFPQAQGRHIAGANYVFADGHAACLSGSRVSSGRNAGAATCGQDNLPALTGCTGTFTAAGTQNAGFTATFSIR